MIDISEEILIKASELIEVSYFEGKTFGFAESLTGGMISSSVVDVPGASKRAPLIVDNLLRPVVIPNAEALKHLLSK